MPNLPPSPDTGDDTGDGPDRESVTTTPRWVKVFGVIAFVVVLLFVIALFTGGHGPGRHSSGGVGGHTPSSNVTEHGLLEL
jgi:hypothetical protein